MASISSKTVTQYNLVLSEDEAHELRDALEYNRHNAAKVVSILSALRDALVPF